MPRKRHSEERIIYALKQIEGGAKGLEDVPGARDKRSHPI